MRRRDKRPEAIRAYREQFAGVVNYEYFDECDTSVETDVAAIDAALRVQRMRESLRRPWFGETELEWIGTKARETLDIEPALVDAAVAELRSAPTQIDSRGFGDCDVKLLRTLGFRVLSRDEFMGTHWSPTARKLVKQGVWTDAHGVAHRDPILETLDGVKFTCGGGELGSPHESGDYARAFAFPPYGLTGTPSSIQAIFDEVTETFMPSDRKTIIRDWCHRDLPKVSAYFEDGNEFWGMFLFTVHVPAERRMCVIMASETD